MLFLIFLQDNIDDFIRETEQEMLIWDTIFYIIIGLIVIGFITNMVNTAQAESEYVDKNDQISEGDISEIIERIDSLSHDEVLINNEWLETNWNSLSISKKRDIVSENLDKFSEELPMVDDYQGFMKLMRNVMNKS